MNQAEKIAGVPGLLVVGNPPRHSLLLPSLTDSHMPPAMPRHPRFTDPLSALELAPFLPDFGPVLA
jgi:hypothetical protein